MKRLLSLFLTIALVLSFLPSVHADAAVNLNKSSLTLTVGTSSTLKIIGTSKAVKWASSKKTVASVSTKGVVSAKSVGTANIVATVSGKKYTCKVSVKEAFSASKAVKNIKVSENDLGDGVVTVLENNYVFPVSLTATAVYYDESGAMIGTSSADNYYFEKGKKCALYFNGPYNSNYENVKYVSYKITYTANQIGSGIVSNVSDLKLESNFGADNVMASITNGGKTKAEFTLVSIVFMKDGNVIGYDYTYAETAAPGNTSYIQFKFPYDDNFDAIHPDDYQIFINGSYYYQ